MEQSEIIEIVNRLYEANDVIAHEILSKIAGVAMGTTVETP